MDEQRERLFKAMSIIACCRLACASLLDQGGNQEVMTDALQAAYDLIDVTAGELEVIGSDGGVWCAAGRWNLAIVVGVLIGVGLATLFVYALTGKCIP
jgi:hypothetical protein